MADAPIAKIELHHIALPTRREHKWTGLTEPIGGYVLVKMTDATKHALSRRPLHMNHCFRLTPRRSRGAI